MVKSYQCTNIQLYKCTNVQKYKCTNVYMYKCTNVQMYKCTQVHKCLKQIIHHHRLVPNGWGQSIALPTTKLVHIYGGGDGIF